MQPNTLYAGQTLTMDTLREAIEKIKAIPEATQWLVVDPQGRMYEGTVEQVMSFVMIRHPLFKQSFVPMALDYNK